jgi:type IX secretion system PorP/SprF family membrane protein
VQIFKENSFKVIFLVLLSTGKLWCQQDPKFTLFNYNYTFINPAAAGSKEQLSVWLLHRQQWLGYKGSPQTNTFCLDMPLVRLRSSVALNLLQENIGISNTLFGGLSYAIIAHTGVYSRLSFGVQIGINQMRTSFSNGNTDPTNTNLNIDEALNYGQNITRYALHVGSGFYYYDRKFKIGLSVPTLNHYNYFGTGSGAKQSHFFIISGINLSINNKIFYNPRLLVKVTKNAPLQFDLYNQFILSEKLATGFTIRSGEAIALVLCYSIHKQFNIAYAYDLVVLNKLRKYQLGSHELSLNYLLPLKHIEVSHKRLRAGRRQKCVDFDDESKKRLKLYKEIENVFYDKN